MTDVPIREAATVALLRDDPGGHEVFMLKRSSAAVFSPSAHVFPGGAIDDDDRLPVAHSWCASIDETHQIPLAYYVAAIREAFEEAGLLLAYDRAGNIVRLDEPEVGERFALHRKAMHAGELSMASMCAAEELTLAVDCLVPFAHWVTPKGAPRRFDTRFFAARAPSFQAATPDEIETIEGRWTRPRDALQAHAAGEVDLILPTQRTLERLAATDGVDATLAALRGPS